MRVKHAGQVRVVCVCVYVCVCVCVPVSQVAFIEMARAGLPLFTLLGLWAARVEIPTNEHIQAVSLSGVGCGISAYGEVRKGVKHVF